MTVHRISGNLLALVWMTCGLGWGFATDAQEKTGITWYKQFVRGECAFCGESIDHVKDRCERCRKTLEWSDPVFADHPRELFWKLQYALRYGREEVLKSCFPDGFPAEAWLERSNLHAMLVRLSELADLQVEEESPSRPNGRAKLFLQVLDESYLFLARKQAALWRLDPPPDLSEVMTNQLEAVRALGEISCLEREVLRRDLDADGKPNFWVEDVAGLVRLGASRVVVPCRIPAEVAAADRSRGRKGATPWRGYFFQALVVDEVGEYYRTYRDWPLAEIERTGVTKFAFAATPAELCRTGRLTFLINENEILLCRDLRDEQSPTAVTAKEPSEDEKEKVKALLEKLRTAEYPAERERCLGVLGRLEPTVAPVIAAELESFPGLVRTRLERLLDRWNRPRGPLLSWPSEPASEGWRSVPARERGFMR